MSIWYDIKLEDISVDGEDIDLLVTSDYSGNIYATVKVKDILKAVAESEANEQAQ